MSTKSDLLEQIRIQESAIDGLVDSDDIAIAQASKSLNDKTAEMLERLQRAGFDVDKAITRNNENLARINSFLKEFA